MLITPEYQRQQQKLHENPNYGVASLKFAPLVAKIVAQTGAGTLLDYGCGKGRLAEGLARHLPEDAEVGITRYDPAVPAWSKLPDGTFDLVCCIDVLEHIEPDCLDDVLDTLASKTSTAATPSVLMSRPVLSQWYMLASRPSSVRTRSERRACCARRLRQPESCSRW